MTISPELVGVPTATLQTWLGEAQQGLHDLTIGGKVKSIQIGAGGTHRQVIYTTANLGALRQWIAELQEALGLVRHARRANRVAFR